jgi:hypothetical protein
MRYAFNALLMLVGALSGSAGAQSPSDGAGHFATGPSPVVVELFTSEGCSSCPPADALLGELARHPNVIPIAFHVDYWDGASWRDRFAIPEAARRQERYVEKLGLSSGFTPQAIIDGRTSFVGSDRRLIADSASAQHAHIAIELGSEGANLVSRLPKATVGGTFDVSLLTYLSAASTRIGGGENSGRKLDEFNIVRSIRRLGSWEGSAESFTVPLSTLPPDADHAVIVVQQPGQGSILAAAAAQVRFLQH